MTFALPSAMRFSTLLCAFIITVSALSGCDAGDLDIIDECIHAIDTCPDGQKCMHGVCINRCDSDNDCGAGECCLATDDNDLACAPSEYCQ